jgi:hypothetical protein
MSQMDDEIQQLTTDVAAERTAVDSAVALIQGFTTQLQNAVDAALAAGATPQQLQSITDLHTAVTQQTQDIAQAVASQAPAGGTPPGATPGTVPGGRRNP